jgi:hypothetical protein
MTNDKTNSLETARAILKKKLDRGAAQAKRGKLVDGEKFITRLLAHLARS